MARSTENSTEIGTIREEDFSVIMSQAFATYGLSVVTDRALPDARDGLKPVQRRILAGMRNARFLSTHATVKSAEVVGLILGNYHPHGDASVYDAAVRLAQPFTLRYPLIEGQGNMGSEDGDAPAAYRYTEMRLSPLAEALMADMERETVPLHPTYKQDPRVQEPDYLPGQDSARRQSVQRYRGWSLNQHPAAQSDRGAARLYRTVRSSHHEHRTVDDLHSGAGLLPGRAHHGHRGDQGLPFHG